MTTSEFLMSMVLLASIFFFGGAAVLAMAWGFKNGQFTNFQRASRAIFDPDEPIGTVTDGFPGDTQRFIQVDADDLSDYRNVPEPLASRYGTIDPRTLPESENHLRPSN